MAKQRKRRDDTAALFVPVEGTGCSTTPPGNQLSVQTITP